MTRDLLTRSRVRAALLAFVAGSAAAAPLSRAAECADSEIPDALTAVIEELRSGEPGAEERASALLRALRPEAAGSIFELEVGRLELEGDVPFDGDLRRFVLGALTTWPATRVGEEVVARLGEEPTYGEAFVALDLLGRAGDEAAVVALLRDLDEDTIWVRHDRFHDAVERALSRCRTRGVSDGRDLGAWVRSTPTHMLSGAARFLAGRAGVDGVRATSLLMDRDPDLDLQLVKALGTRDPRGDREVEDARARLLRRSLWNGSLARRRQAIASLAAIHDRSLAPELITMLDGDDESLRTCAHGALRRLAGSDVGGASPKRWKLWYAAEEAWRKESLPALMKTLRRGEPGPAVRALREARGHPFLRRELESALVPHIRHAEPLVAADVCRTLAALDCRGAIGALEDFTASSRRGRVLGEARKALANLVE